MGGSTTPQPVARAPITAFAREDSIKIRPPRGFPVVACSGTRNVFEGFDFLVEWEFEDDPESFLEVVGPGEVGVGSHDPVELDHLLAGQGVGVAQQRVAAALDAGGVGGVGPGGRVAAGPAAGAPGVVGPGLLSSPTCPRTARAGSPMQSGGHA